MGSLYSFASFCTRALSCGVAVGVFMWLLRCETCGIIFFASSIWARSSFSTSPIFHLASRNPVFGGKSGRWLVIGKKCPCSSTRLGACVTGPHL